MVLNIPERWLGNPKKKKRSEFVFDESGIHSIEFKTPQAAIQTVKEIITNIADATAKARRRSIKIDKPAEITIDERRVKAKNYQVCIPVEKFYDKVDKETLWLPTMLFSKLRAGSNFNIKEGSEVNKSAGRHGEGGKLTNFFSSYFKLEVGDPSNKKVFRQIWRRNAQETDGPQIEENYDGEAYVEVEYELEFWRFDKMLGWSKSDIDHFRWMCINLSMTLDLDIIFNGESV